MAATLGREIKTIDIKSELYPSILKKIPSQPSTLYIRGEMLPDENCFGIVGTRRCSDYGKEIAFSFAKELAGNGLTIISGIARGIDTFAHKGALEAMGRTIAVLGTGLDEKSIYPQENLGLARKILESNGCLISEYPAGTHGSRFTFPQRNRIISGLSLGILVVEAKFGSGALITAKLAKKQGRKVFAVPGLIQSKNSQGPHYLIKQGAMLVTKPEDILKELKIEQLPLTRSSPQSVGGENETENKILEILKCGNLHIDEIIEKTKLSSHVVSASLSLMEIENKLKNLGENVYALSR